MEHTHTITFEVPDSTELDAQSLREYLAAKLYGDGKLSLYEAANMVGVKKWDMPKILVNFGVSFFNYPPEEITRGAANA